MKLTEYQKTVIDNELEKELASFRKQFPRAGNQLFPDNEIKDVLVQVFNPKTKQYTLINKTKGEIIGVSVGDIPFHGVEIITEALKISDDKLRGDELKSVMENIPDWTDIETQSKNLNSGIAAVTGKTDDQLRKALADLKKQFANIRNPVHLPPYVPAVGKTVTPQGKSKSCPNSIFVDGIIENPEFTFGDAVKNAMTTEKSMADKAFDKFKEDERKHILTLIKVLKRINDFGNLTTANDAKTSMVIMWELLREGYIEDVTPTARTGGAAAPDTTYCYRITHDGKYFAGCLYS